MSTMAGEWGCGSGWEFLRRLREEALGAQTSARHRGSRRTFAGPFGPWGAAWGQWGEPPRRPRAGKGDVRLAILALLSEGPRHGYQVIQDIADRSKGAWTPSPGSVYPALSALQDEGLVDDEKVEGRRVFSLTQAGTDYVASHRADVDEVFTAYDEAEPEGAEDLRHLMVSVGGAAMQVVAAGRQDEAQRILAKARRELFAVLAADDEES